MTYVWSLEWPYQQTFWSDAASHAEFNKHFSLQKYERENKESERRIEILSSLFIVVHPKVVSSACAKLSNGHAQKPVLKTGENKGYQKEYHKPYHLIFVTNSSEDIAGLAIYRISKMDIQASEDEGKSYKKIWPLWMVYVEESDIKCRNRKSSKTMNAQGAQYR